jgi:hypothetical protein
MRQLTPRSGAQPKTKQNKKNSIKNSREIEDVKKK